MNFKELESSRKLRGGYYTPAAIAEPLCRWALAGGAATVLEPSCGSGNFLRSLLGVREAALRPMRVDGVELLPEEAELSAKVAAGAAGLPWRFRIDCDDFFSWVGRLSPDDCWEAVVGNPPYIRYQYFDAGQRDRAEAIFRRAGLRCTKRTNAWVPFLAGSLMHTAPGGRIAMVVPSEIMYIQHAHELRLLLEQELEHLRLVHIRDIVFEGTLQGTAILAGVKKARRFRPLRSGVDEAGADFSVVDIGGADGLAAALGERAEPCGGLEGRWMRALLSADERHLLRQVGASSGVRRLSEMAANVDIGILTGANKYFCVAGETVAKYGLSEIAKPVVAHSRLVKGLAYTPADHDANSGAGEDAHFLEFPRRPASELPAGMRRYIEFGESQGLHKRFKCRIREPWYCVPSVWISEINLPACCHLYHRLVLNQCGAH